MNQTKNLQYEPPPGGEEAFARDRPRSQDRSRWQEPDAEHPLDEIDEDFDDDLLDDEDDESDYIDNDEDFSESRHSSRSAGSRADRQKNLDDTGLIPWAGINIVMIWVVRILALATIYLTTIGSIAAFHSGGITSIWKYIFTPWEIPDHNALLYGGVSQFVVTIIEYWRNPGPDFWKALLRGDFSVLRENKLYATAIGTDVVLTTLGYNPAAIPWLQDIITSAVAVPVGNWITSQTTAWGWVPVVLSFVGPLLVSGLAYLGLLIGSLIAATWPEGRLVRR